MQVGEQRPGLVFARVWGAPGESLEGEHAERVDIRARVEGLAAQLLRRQT